MSRITVNFPDADSQALDIVSKRLKCSKSALINQLCSEALHVMVDVIHDVSDAPLDDADGSLRLSGGSVLKIKSRIADLRSQIFDAEVQLGLFKD